MREGSRDLTKFGGVLLDLGGVVYVGSRPIEVALDAIKRLRAAGIPLRFITNTTRRSHRQMIADLAHLGLEVPAGELITPAMMARRYLKKNGLFPFLLVHPDLKEDFDDHDFGTLPGVVVGDAGPLFTYDRLNQAYRKLAAGAPLLALAKNRIFKDRDGGLSLDAGPFVAALEYASKTQAVLLGKPSAEFFNLAADGMGCDGSQIVMIGDDVEADVGGAMAARLQGLLVRTGKYQAGDERELAEPPHLVAGNLAEAVTHIIDRYS